MGHFVVTGANRGIGLEMCCQLLDRGERVTAACRKTSPELDELAGDQLTVVAGIDVTSDESVGRLVTSLDDQPVDVLINNAGILLRETIDNLDFDQIDRQFAINSVGPLRVTSALLGNLKRGARVAIITSRMGSIADNTSGSRYGYRMSKAAVNMAGVSLAHDLKPRGVAVALLHPGMVATDMTGHHGISTTEAVEGLLARIDGLNLDNSGTFWHQKGEILPW